MVYTPTVRESDCKKKTFTSRYNLIHPIGCNQNKNKLSHTVKSHLKMLTHRLAASERCDTAEAVLHVFALDSASVTPGSHPVRVVPRPGLVLLS